MKKGGFYLSVYDIEIEITTCLWKAFVVVFIRATIMLMYHFFHFRFVSDRFVKHIINLFSTKVCQSN